MIVIPSFIVLAAAIYGGACAVFYFLQDYFFFLRRYCRSILSINTRFRSQK